MGEISLRTENVIAKISEDDLRPHVDNFHGRIYCTFMTACSRSCALNDFVKILRDIFYF